MYFVPIETIIICINFFHYKSKLQSEAVFCLLFFKIFVYMKLSVDDWRGSFWSVLFLLAGCLQPSHVGEGVILR